MLITLSKVRVITIKRVCLIALLMINFQLSSKEIVVEIFKKEFIPADVKIIKGDTVIWKNIEKRQYHNVWFKHLTQAEPDYFFPGESFQITFDELGKYHYICGPHPKMTGTVTVLSP
ncbi:cupredoxin domain-containing protein [Thalassotalea profundi]|uniref:Blue (type 1) copper domain-containing protein n=1 Tax=Thalassotalea profundi TaxID=2036687 RepID=A0ABQ3IMI7_9GAMM|nr:plastocyanin/azurin family copper-binding protein [Thalassotalea profundi]GHE83943.1 hypothetical protein GCM10011501_10790 [Thalassotalea profundi]